MYQRSGSNVTGRGRTPHKLYRLGLAVLFAIGLVVAGPLLLATLASGQWEVSSRLLGWAGIGLVLLLAVGLVRFIYRKRCSEGQGGLEVLTPNQAVRSERFSAPSRRTASRYALVILLGLLVSALGPQLLQAAQPAGQAELQAVWDRVRESGAYTFTGEMTQTTTPRTASRENKQERVYLEGRTDLPADALNLTLWSAGGSVLQAETGVQIKVEQGKAYVRQGTKPWTETDDFTGLFAPGGDFTTYLVAAQNVVRHPPETRTFALPNLSTGAGVRGCRGERAPSAGDELSSPAPLPPCPSAQKEEPSSPPPELGEGLGAYAST